MSVTIATSTPQQSSWWQRVTGTEPKTVVTETSRTEITNDPGGSFNLRTALRNGGIGAAVAGALGGVSLLGKVALPIIGKVVTVGGLAKLAGIGGAIGIATAALPLVAPKLRDSPTAKAALLGAGIGAAAGAILPLIPIPIGAAIGAGVALLIKHRKDNPNPIHTEYPGYRAYPGFVPAGTSPGDTVPNGLVPVSPNYGMYGQTAQNPYGMGMPGYPAPGYTPQGSWGSPYGSSYGASPYGASPYGYGMSLPATAGQAQQPVATPAVAPAPAPVRRPAATKTAVRSKAKTFTDKAGNVRQVGTGKILKPTTRVATAGVGTVPAGTPAPVGFGAPAGYGAPAAGIGQLTSPASYLPGMAGTLPFSGGSPFAAPAAGMSSLPSGLPQAVAGAAGGYPSVAGMQPTAIPARPVA